MIEMVIWDWGWAIINGKKADLHFFMESMSQLNGRLDIRLSEDPCTR
jgi:hypothetical protein